MIDLQNASEASEASKEEGRVRRRDGVLFLGVSRSLTVTCFPLYNATSPPLSHHLFFRATRSQTNQPHQVINLSRQCLHVPRTSPVPPKKITANIPIRQSVQRFRPPQLAWLPSAPTRRPPAVRSFPSVPPSRIMLGASAVLTAESPASLWNPASLTKSIPIRPTPSYGSVLTRRYACCIIFFAFRA